jgi:hypothetical protein
MTAGTVYLLHFDEPMPRNRGQVVAPVQHYVGWAGRLADRLEHHRRGSGARILAALAERGIGFELARTWRGDRHLERRIKTRTHFSRLCPRCRAIGPHRAAAIACDGCQRPVCRGCQRHLIRVLAGQPRAHWRHSTRVGCAREAPIAD